MQHPPSLDGRLPQLDGLRAVAIVGVVAHHLLPLGPYWPNTGYLGVSLFFVLSGFLITRILLDARQRIADGESTRTRQVGVFYIRRAMRIFPVYFVTLGVLLLIGFPRVGERWIWHATYLSNWFFTVNHPAGGMDRHLWSLSVEEQFYLVWPLWILLSPRRLLVPGLVVAALMGPLWRGAIAFYFAGPDYVHIWTYPGAWSEWPTPANLDLLAGGGLLAAAWGRARPWWLWTVFLVSLPAVVMVCYWQVTPEVEPWWLWLLTFNSSAVAICFVGVVGLVALGLPGVFGKALSAKPVVFIGTISYAMYLFHVFMGAAARAILPESNPAGWAVGLLGTALTIGLASVSWFVLERPINRLKSKIPYAQN